MGQGLTDRDNEIGMGKKERLEEQRRMVMKGGEDKAKRGKQKLEVEIQK